MATAIKDLVKQAKARVPTAGWDSTADLKRAREYLRSINEDSVEAFPEDVIAFLRRLGMSPEKCGHLLLWRWPEIFRVNELYQAALPEAILTVYIESKDKPGSDAAGDGWWEGEQHSKQVCDLIEMDLRLSLDLIQIALAKSSFIPLYKMGSRLVHPYRSGGDSEATDLIRRADDSLIVGDVSALRLLEYVNEAVDLRKKKKVKVGNRTEFRYERIVPPLRIASHILARPDRWNFRPLLGVIETPTLRADGSLLVDEGYDPQSGLLFDAKGNEFPPIKERPTRADAETALEFFKQVFKDFPFVVEDDGESPSRSVALSAALTILVRRTLRSAPAHASTAPIMATGKSLLLNAVAMIGTGRQPAVMSQGRDSEEDEKRLLAVLMKNDAMLVIDNIMRPVEGEALCSILTESSWQGRRLGTNETVTVPTNCLITMSGNNLTFKGDMTTRAVLCRMDAGVERPEERQFDIDLKRWIPENRGKLVAAGLTVLRAFVVAGRPGLDTFRPFGRFEDWSNLVRGALIWLGEADPCRTREAVISEDGDRDALGCLLDALADVGGWMTAADIVNAKDHAAVAAALEGQDYEHDPKRLGRYLQTKHGQIIDGVRLEMRKDSHRKINVFRAIRLEVAAEPAFDFG